MNNDVNARYANALACRWAERRLGLEEGMVTAVTYQHSPAIAWSELTFDDSWSQMSAELREPIPVEDRLVPMDSVELNVDIATALREMLELAEPVADKEAG